MEERLKQLNEEFNTFVSEWGGQNQIVYEADNLWEWIVKNFVPLNAPVMPNEVLAGGNCGTCKYWKELIDKDYPYGDCTVEIKFPDSSFARSAGMRKTMRDYDGKNCPCYESQREA